MYNIHIQHNKRNKKNYQSFNIKFTKNINLTNTPQNITVFLKMRTSNKKVDMYFSFKLLSHPALCRYLSRWF